MAELCIIYDKVRFEEKELYDKARKRGLNTNLIDAKNISIGTDNKKNDFDLGDIILQRSISHYRGLYLTACLEFLGFLVINSFKVGEICGNKLLTSIKLAKEDIPTPTTHFAFSSESLSNLITMILLFISLFSFAIDMVLPAISNENESGPLGS